MLWMVCHTNGQTQYRKKSGEVQRTYTQGFERSMRPIADKPKTALITKDSLLITTQDSLFALSAVPANAMLQRKMLTQHPYFNFKDAPKKLLISKREPQPGREIFFYTLLGLLLLFAGFRTGFDKYFSGMFSLFFKTTLKQRQVKQQLMQDALSSRIFNLFHAIIFGFYLSLIFTGAHSFEIPFIKLLLFCISGVAAAYLLKYLILKLIGWLFDISYITNEYIFTVFYVNKLISLALLPIVLLAALGNQNLSTVAFTLSWIIIGGFLLYRYIISAPIARKAMGISLAHFILYMLAFEVLPILILYKAIANLLK